MLDLEKGEEQEIKLKTSVGSSKKQDSSRKTSASLTTLKPLTLWITINWKILQEMGIPDHLICLLKNLYPGQEATVRTGHAARTGSQLEKECVTAVYCHPAYLTYMQSISCKMLGWMKHKLEPRMPGKISITMDMQMAPPYGRKWRTKNLLMKVKKESEKAGLKLSFQKTKIMASGPITNRWGDNGNSDRLYFLGLQNHCR